MYCECISDVFLIFFFGIEIIRVHLIVTGLFWCIDEDEEWGDWKS